MAAVGRIIRATQQDKNTRMFRKDMDAELSAWEKRLPKRLGYYEHETDPRAKLFAVMLSLGFQYMSSQYYSTIRALIFSVGAKSCSINRSFSIPFRSMNSR